MRIFAIESSCDESAVALLEDGLVLGERIASQIDMHARFGGVVPELASREHLRALPPMVADLFAECRCGWSSVDAIAVTAGPGLMGALLVGVSYASGIAVAGGLPLTPVHHLEGHLLAAGIEGGDLPTPSITLLVSGGHSLLVRVDGVGHYHILGQTVDDAAGECFDKCARMLGLGYPGGPAIAAAACGGDGTRFDLPRPMLHQPNLNFSFSGLKTALSYLLRDQPDLLESADGVSAAAASVEEAICTVLVAKSLRACRESGVRDLVVAGGVAANRRLRTELAASCAADGISLHLPQGSHCTDNAAMIAYAAWLRHRHGMAVPSRSSWDARARWSLDELSL
ncbi:MAG: tRNA (adenosine(37)-N6)-threonylcarbamoyltransferase complex transferase subunit TsaD [Mariprofundales bacterium]|nr:tRNA (adenosine(37)-N6)-threonylcarbamoyltransferase complex transferase subunit TsaD [Mariprofundales bacterium]